MLDPRTVMVAIPCYSGQIMAELSGMLVMGARYYAALTEPTECSHVSLVRNIIAGQFLESNFEWLVCIDSDIVPSGTRDLLLLLEPCELEMDYQDPDTNPNGAVPRPSRVITAQPDSLVDLNHQTARAADMLVCAEYVYKDDNLRPCRYGLGFTRIHRSVFERLQALRHDGGPTVEVDRVMLQQLENITEPGADFNPVHVMNLVRELIARKTDKAGESRLWQVTHKGKLYTDFYPSGPALSQVVPGTEWKGEDHGFFTLCHLAGIIPRIETRTRLLHIGRKAYPYLGPNVGGGQ